MGSLGGVVFILVAILLIVLGVSNRFSATWQAITGGAGASGSSSADPSTGTLTPSQVYAAANGPQAVPTDSFGAVAGTLLGPLASASYSDASGAVVKIAPVTVSVPTPTVGSNGL